MAEKEGLAAKWEDYLAMKVIKQKCIKIRHIAIVILYCFACTTYAMEEQIKQKKKQLQDLQVKKANLVKEIADYNKATEFVYVKADNKTITQLFTRVYGMPRLKNSQNIEALTKNIKQIKQNALKLQKEKQTLEKEKKLLLKTQSAESPDLVKELLQRNIQLFLETPSKMLDEKYRSYYSKKEDEHGNKSSEYKANTIRLWIINWRFFEDPELKNLMETKYRDLAKKSEKELEKIYNKIKAVEKKIPYSQEVKQVRQVLWGDSAPTKKLIWYFPPKNWTPPKDWNLPKNTTITFYTTKTWKAPSWKIPTGWTRTQLK